WQPVTDAVHAAGGHIFAQLWHMGRLVHSSLGGGQAVSASATTAPHKAHTYDGRQPYEEARALRLDEIPELIGDYEKAAANALRAPRRSAKSASRSSNYASRHWTAPSARPRSIRSTPISARPSTGRWC